MINTCLAAVEPTPAACHRATCLSRRASLQCSECCLQMSALISKPAYLQLNHREGVTRTHAEEETWGQPCVCRPEHRLAWKGTRNHSAPSSNVIHDKKSILERLLFPFLEGGAAERSIMKLCRDSGCPFCLKEIRKRREGNCFQQSSESSS